MDDLLVPGQDAKLASMGSSGQDGERPRKHGCIIAAGIAAILLFLLFKACQWADAHPSDDEMLGEFAARRANFQTLLDMVQDETRVTRVADDFIWIDGAQGVSGDERHRYLPSVRLAKYRELFAKLELESGVIRRADGTIAFLRSSSGMVTSGSGKEFIWSPKPLPGAMTSSDKRSLEVVCMPRTNCSSLREILPNWYIGFQSN